MVWGDCIQFFDDGELIVVLLVSVLEFGRGVDWGFVVYVEDDTGFGV
jgi:hypothetical protein